MSDSEVSSQAVQQARQLMNESKHGQALAYFMIALQSSPDMKVELRDEFGLAFVLSCEQLVERQDFDNLFYCYNKACQVYPDCDLIYNTMGSVMYRLGYLDDATACFRKALSINPSLSSAHENLENLCCHMVDQWHYRMLNDQNRNQLFKSAIRNAVMAGTYRVLDIGSGTGILGMFAAQCGADMVYGCDESKTMYEMSCDIMSANKMDGLVNIIHKNSADLKVNEDVPFKFDLIVTETVDSGLFGERILSTLSHAWKNLINKDELKSQAVIPGKAVVYCTLIECEEVRKHHRCVYPALREVELADMTLVDFTSQPAQVLPDPADFDPYTTYDLRNIRGGYKMLTPTYKVLDVNFNDEKCIDHLLKGHVSSLGVTVTQAGHCDAIAMWFELYLDAKTKLCTSMAQSKCCWQPAVYPSLTNSFCHVGDTAVIQVTCVNDCLQLHLMTPIQSGLSASHKILNDSKTACADQVTKSSTILRSTDSKNHPDHALPISESATVLTDDLNSAVTVPDSSVKSKENSSAESNLLKYSRRLEEASAVAESECQTFHCDCNYEGKMEVKGMDQDTVFYLQSNEIYRLNDIDYSSAVCLAITEIKSQMSQEHFKFLDLSKNFSLLSVQASKLKADESCWVTSNSYHKQIVERLCERNDITDVTTVDSMEQCPGLWDCIYFDVLEADGTLRGHILEDIAMAKLTCLSESGIVLPVLITLHGLCINSESLLENAQVLDDSRTCGLQIASFINEFQPSTYRDIDMVTLEYERLTEPFEIMSLDLNSKAVDCKGLPLFLSSESVVEAQCVHDSGPSLVSAVMFWFELKFTDSVTVSTLDVGHHWKQAAVILKKDLEVVKGDILQISAKVTNGSFSIDIQ